MLASLFTRDAGTFLRLATLFGIAVALTSRGGKRKKGRFGEFVRVDASRRNGQKTGDDSTTSR